jgi:hypothetical protein
MGKIKTGKALSVAAAANLAVAGFVPSSASAATHATTPTITTSTTAAAVPSAGRSALSPAARQANAIRAQASGFVPKTRPGAKPDTGHNCTASGQLVCVEVRGHGLYVSKISEIFESQAGCHVASWYFTPLHFGQDRALAIGSGHKGCYYSNAIATFTSRPQPSHPVGTFPSSVSVCGGFWNVPRKVCIPVTK